MKKQLTTIESVFKTSELVKLVPEIAPSVDNKDWMHTAIINDVQGDKVALITYVWDTRIVANAAILSKDTPETDALLGTDIVKLNTALANDNNMPVKLASEEFAFAFDYIDYLNHDMLKGGRGKLTCETTKASAGHVRKVYSINGVQVCTTYKWEAVNYDENGNEVKDKGRETTWHIDGLEQLFGLNVHYYDNVLQGSKDKALTKQDIKDIIATNFCLYV